MDMLYKKKPLTIKNEADKYLQRVFASEESYNRYFFSNYLHNYVKPGAKAKSNKA